MSGRFINPSKTSVYFQSSAGALPERLFPQAMITAPNGKGFNWESDFSGRTYKGSRITSNRSRVTFNLQARREDISSIRDKTGNGESLFQIIVLESDVDENPSFANFDVGTVLLDCGLTSRAVSQNLSDTTTTADSKQMDILSFTAADWIELRPADVRQYVPSTFNASAILRRLAYSPTVSSLRGITEFLVAVGQLAGNGIGYYTFGRGDGTWTALATTGLPATLNITSATIVGNRLLIGTTKGIYNLNLTNLTAVQWYLSNGVLATDSILDIFSPGAGIIIAVSTNANGEYFYSTDQGFSFTRVASGLTGQQMSKIAGISETMIWIAANNRLVRLIAPNKFTAFSTINPDGSALSTPLTAVAVPPNRPDEVYVGTSDGRILRSLNAGAPTPSFEQIFFQGYGNSGSPQTITDMTWSMDGAVLFLTQTDAVAVTYTQIDYSSGHAGSAGAAKILPPVGAVSVIAFNPTDAVAVNAGAYVYLYE